MPIKTGLIAQYLSGGSLLDQTGRNAIGVLTAGVSKGFVPTGIGRGGLDFDGINTLFTAAGVVSNWPLSVAFDLYLKPGITASQPQLLSLGSFRLLFLSATGRLFIEYSLNNWVYSNTNAIVLGRVYHIHMYLPGVTAGTQMYINNVLQTGVTNTAVEVINTPSTFILRGSAIPALTVVPGYIAQDCKIWNRVLTDSERNIEFNEYQTAVSVGQIASPVFGFIYPTVADSNAVLVEDFLNNGADGISKTPTGWVKGTGVFNVTSYGKLASGDRITNGGFTSWNGAADPNNFPTGWTLSGNATNYVHNATNACQMISDSGAVQISIPSSLIIGRRYRVNITITARVSGQIKITAGVTVELFMNSVGNFTRDFTADGINFTIRRDGACNMTFTNVSCVEILPFLDWQEDTRILNCSSAGTVIFPINLNALTGNGRINYKYFTSGGSWATRTGLINAPVSGVAYANGVLTFTVGTGDKIAQILVTRG